MKQALLTALAFLGLAFFCSGARAQAPPGTMSDAEVESLRDASYVPLDRLAAYVNILDTREERIDALLARRQRPGFAQDMHDLMEQFGSIADELNDNLNEVEARHRDVRKALPKLVTDTARWSTALRAPPEDDRYKIVRRIALDSLKDMREEAKAMETSQAAYFAAHPDAARAEHERKASPHAPNDDPDR